ncbi:hypothetical protein [Brevibacillus laterosporus]|uniref:hypothetical protein n=1 Tax=Brevibacillus laterosporus TaxID=1465 RepID=UPI002E2384B6|nr:hypothetical protein [Brevibacillus laterosporus]MED1667136.1 hypothetical protein [Brevibacillus laterosporus]MED1719796.1 hypothetical protein [Brevibacillus laterosporus]
MIKSYKNYHNANITEKYMRDGNKLLDMTLNGLGGTEVVINGVIKLASILSKYSKTEQWLKTLIMRNGDFSVGDIVKVNGRNWLVTLLDQENPLYQKGTMIFCNQTIKWQDQFIIHESPCYVTKLGYIGGVEEDKNFTLPDKQMRAIIPETEATSRIRRDRRFIFNHSVFKVIDLNLLNDGLIDLVVAEDVSNIKDNFNLGIADYTPCSNEIRISSPDGYELQKGSSFKLKVDVLQNGSPLLSPPLSYTSNFPNIVNVDKNGICHGLDIGQANITVSMGSLNSSILVNVTEDIRDNFLIDIIGSETIVQGDTERYSVIFSNNGIEIDDIQVSWLITDDHDKPINYLTIANADQKTCIIQATKKLGYFRLWAKAGEITNYKEVKVKSLFG